VNDREISILRNTAPFVVHNPESNMGNAVGCAPVLDMLKRGVRVGLGTDGYTADMLESLRSTNLLHRHQQQDASAAWVEPHTMLFEQNADFASACFGETLGRLMPGALADIIIVDYDPPTPMTQENLNGHVIFGMTGRSVASSVINGRIVMQDRQICLVDEKAEFAKARELAAALWRRF